MKDVKSTKKTIQEVSDYISYFKKMNEGIVFDAAEGIHPEMGGEPAPEGGVPNGEQQSVEDAEANQAAHAQELIQHEPIVGKIREVAIEGLKKYSDNPTSELYLYFKSVFLDSDKLITGKGK